MHDQNKSNLLNAASDCSEYCLPTSASGLPSRGDEAFWGETWFGDFAGDPLLLFWELILNYSQILFAQKLFSYFNFTTRTAFAEKRKKSITTTATVVHLFFIFSMILFMLLYVIMFMKELITFSYKNNLSITSFSF